MSSFWDYSLLPDCSKGGKVSWWSVRGLAAAWSLHPSVPRSISWRSVSAFLSSGISSKMKNFFNTLFCFNSDCLDNAKILCPQILWIKRASQLLCYCCLHPAQEGQGSCGSWLWDSAGTGRSLLGVLCPGIPAPCLQALSLAGLLWSHGCPVVRHCCIHLFVFPCKGLGSYLKSMTDEI